MNESKLSAAVRHQWVRDGIPWMILSAGPAFTAPTSRPGTATPPTYPWDAPGVQTDVAKVFNLLPEPYLLAQVHRRAHPENRCRVLPRCATAGPSIPLRSRR